MPATRPPQQSCTLLFDVDDGAVKRSFAPGYVRLLALGTPPSDAPNPPQQRCAPPPGLFVTGLAMNAAVCLRWLPLVAAAAACWRSLARFRTESPRGCYTAPDSGDQRSGTTEQCPGRGRGLGAAELSRRNDQTGVVARRAQGSRAGPARRSRPLAGRRSVPADRPQHGRPATAPGCLLSLRRPGPSWPRDTRRYITRVL